MNKKITVVGAGYVGLSIATLLSQHNDVTILDIVPEKIENINNRVSPLSDDYIEKFFTEKKLRLSATSEEEPAYEGSEFVIVAVPTNYDCEKNRFDTSLIEDVVESALHFNSDALIIIKSTTPVGYTESIRKMFKTDRIAFSPEFLRESKALYDNLYPSRIIISDDIPYQNKIKEFASLLVEGSNKENIDILYISSAEAESVKLFTNTFLAMRVAFFNELDTFAELSGMNSGDIIKGISSDPRIGNYYNNPSFGYGGYCLPKDTRQLASIFSEKNINAPIISSITESNETRKARIADQVMKAASRNDSKGNATIGIFRLIMKSKSDNFREAAVIGVIEKLKEKGATVVIYEPSTHEKEMCGCPVEPDISKFKAKCDVIIANRFDFASLYEVKSKVYTRDVFNTD